MFFLVLIIIYLLVTGSILYVLRKSRTFRNSFLITDYLSKNKSFKANHFIDHFKAIDRNPYRTLDNLVTNNLLVSKETTSDQYNDSKFTSDDNSGKNDYSKQYKLHEFTYLAPQHEAQVKKQLSDRKILYGGYQDLTTTTTVYKLVTLLLLLFFLTCFVLYSFIIIGKIEITTVLFFIIVYFQANAGTKKLIKIRRNYIYRFSNPKIIVVTDKQEIRHNARTITLSAIIRKKDIKDISVSYNIFQRLRNLFHRFPKGDISITTIDGNQVVFHGILFPNQFVTSILTDDPVKHLENCRKMNILRILFKHEISVNPNTSTRKTALLRLSVIFILSLLITILYFFSSSSSQTDYGISSLVVFLSLFFLLSWLFTMRIVSVYRELASSLLGGAAVTILVYLLYFRFIMTIEKASMQLIIAVTGFFLILHLISPDWTTPSRSIGIVFAWLSLLVFISFTNIFDFLNWYLSLSLSVIFSTMFLVAIFPE
ncbi:MAG: hypothetical protein ACTSP4_01990 [Candidatus Hodarchaeales archaeon]